MTQNQTRKVGSAIALLAAGLVAGGVLSGTLNANAVDGTTGATGATGSSGAASANPNPGDTSKPQRPDETLLTGDTLAKVKAAVLAKYAGATFTRVETDSDGVYEAHIVKADGTAVVVELDKAFAITGEKQGGRGGGRHGGGGFGETALTGDTLAKVKAAVLAKFPGATIDRAETDNDGVYEAHITKADATHTTVEVDKSFAVTGEEAGHGDRAAADSSTQTG